MQYILMDYVGEAGWPQLTRAEQQHWLGAYKSSVGLQQTSAATTVRVAEGKTQVLDGPYADSKEQLGGFHIIEVADLDAAIAWAARISSSSSRCRRGASAHGGHAADQGHDRFHQAGVREGTCGD